MSKVKKIVHENAYGLMQARIDQAFLTGQPLVERTFWFQNIETGQEYYDLYGCVGWPSEVQQKKSDWLGKETDRPGYVGIIGVVKLKDDTKKPENAPFRLLAEAESFDVNTLIDHLLRLRNEWGFGLHSELLHTFLGDPGRYIPTLALKNERLMEVNGEANSILLSPPIDFENQNFFDEAYRSLYSTLEKDHVRLYFGKNNILKHRIMEFKVGEPAVIAVGGLMQWLLFGTPWLQSSRSNSMFVIEKEGEENDIT
jgi:hypothetical protein